MKPIRFVYSCFLLAGTLAVGQISDAPPRNQPVAPKTSRPSTFLSPPTSRGSLKIPGIVSSRRRQTPQTPGLSFANPVTYDSGGIGTEAVAAADVNGDGYPDLVIANDCGSSTCAAGSVTVLLNNGNGTFGAAVAYGSGGIQPLAVAVADVNGDGKPDIVVANSCASVTGTAGCTNGSVTVLLGNGDGTFQTAVSYDSGGFDALWVVIADVNLDGKPDLVVVNTCGTSSTCSGDSSVAVLLGNGDGTFQTAVNYDTGGTESAAVAVADVGGNNNPDLIVTSQCLGVCNAFPGPQATVGILLGNGDGTFQPVVNYATESQSVSNVAVADVNGDGILDLAVNSPCEGEDQSCYISGEVVVLLGNGDGTFQTPSQFPSIGNYQGGLVAVQDVNGDGKPDLVVSAECVLGPPSCSSLLVVSVEVLLGNGDGTFQSAQTFGPFGYSDQTIPGLAMADVDGDGRPDLILTSRCADSLCNSTVEDGLVAVLINTSIFPNSAASTTTLVSSLNPSSVGQTVTFTVTVSPSGSSGTPTGTVNLMDGSTSLGLFPLNSSGVATPAITTLSTGTNSIAASYNGDATLTPSTSAALSQVVLGLVLSPGSLTFGNQHAGTTSAAQAVTLTNTAKIPVSISSIGISGTNASDFAQSNNCPGSLSSGSSCIISVTFTPNAAGSLVANLSIDSLPASAQTVALAGTGVIQPISLSPLSITFPAQYVGTSGLPQTVTLTNNSVLDVTISVTTSTKDFGSLSACAGTVYAQSSCSIGVFFDPTQGGSRTGALTVTDSLGALTASLSGSGEDFSLASSSPSATVMAGQSATYMVSISPVGGFNETVNLACSGAPAQSTCSFSSDSVKLNGSTPASVKVTVTTAGSSAVFLPREFFPGERGNVPVLLGMALFGLSGGLVLYRGRRFKSPVPVSLLLGLLCIASLGLSLGGCGGSSTSANTYNLSVTGTFASGSTTLTNTAKLTLVVE